MQLPRLVLCALVLALPFMLSASAGTDLWWHLAAGELMVHQGGLPTTAPWTYTSAGEPWIHPAWLAEIALYRAHHLGGELGLLLLRAPVLLLLLSAWLVAVERRVEVGGASVLLVGLPWALLSPLTGLGPQTLTWALVPLLIVLIDQAARGRWWSLFAIPATVLVWANAHSGALIGWGLAALGLILVALGLEGDRRAEEGPLSKRFRLACLGAAATAMLVPLLTPSVFAMPGYLLAELSPDHPVRGWGEPPGAPLRVMLLAAAAMPFVLWAQNRVRIRPTAWIGLVLATVQAMQHASFMALVLLLAPICIAEIIGPPLRDRLSRDFDLDFIGRNPVGVGIALLLALAIGSPLWPHEAGRLTVDHSRTPTAALAWLSRSSASQPQRLLLPGEWGGFAIYHLYPEWTVSDDGRSSAGSSSDRLARYRRGWIAGDPTDLLDPEPSAILGPAQSAITSHLREDRRWSVAYEDATAVVFSRADLDEFEPDEAQGTP